MDAAMEREWELWWSQFPEKVGKLAARKEYEKARKIATAQDLLDGVAKYRQHKPAWKAWCNPRTYLSQGRWLDEYGPVASVAPLVPFEQTDMHQQMYRNNARYRADWDAKHAN